jgi:hypothetical protein
MLGILFFVYYSNYSVQRFILPFQYHPFVSSSEMENKVHLNDNHLSCKTYTRLLFSSLVTRAVYRRNIFIFLALFILTYTATFPVERSLLAEH